MSWLDGLREKLRPLRDRMGLQSELDDEMAFHFEREVESNIGAGMDPRAAIRAARRRMGGAFIPAESIRGMWKGYGLGGLGQELRLAVRRLRRRPGFTVVATLTLALGIGANAAIFSLVRGVLIRPLPYEQPDGLAFIWSPERDTETHLSAKEWLEYRAALETFDDLATYTDFETSLTRDAEPERVRAAAVTPNTFPILGVRPLHGRLFRDEEDVSGVGTVVILSYELWQRRYGGDETVVGRTITANGVSANVVGILPSGFRLPLDYRLERPTELFTTSGIDPTSNLAWGNRGWFVFGRLASGVTPALATAEVRTVSSRWIEEGFVPETVGATDREALSVSDLLLAGMRTPLLVLMGAVGFILLIACANVAHLLLARSEARRGEVAVAAALGASRGRLARQHLIENGLLATLGAIVGVGLATIGLKLAVGMAPVALIRMRDVALDGTVLAFAAALTIGTTLIAGLAPALRLTRIPLTAAMGNVRGSGGGGRGPVRRSLVAIESALAVILVIGAALLGRSFIELSQIEVGFESSNVLAGGLTVAAAGYPDPEDVGSFFRDLTERVGRLPGVEAAAAVRKIPLGESIGSWTITLEEPLPDPDENVEPDWQIVTAGYFDVMRVDIREGRALTSDDRAGGVPVAVISGAMADRYWPGESAIGKRFQLGTLDQPMIEIVGVAHDVTHNSLLEDPRHEMYLSHEQWPEMQGAGGGARRTMALLVRTRGDPMASLAAVRGEVAAIDPSMPLANPQPLSIITGGALAEQKFTAGVFGLFAGLALLLAAIGLYGVTAYATSRRTNEIGIRIALGADRRNVAGLVVKEAIAVAGIGVIVGGIAAAWLTRFLETQLYGVSPLDTGTFVAVPAILLGVAALAAYVPARRAARIDPVTALRSEG